MNPDRVVGGRYHLDHRLDSGGMADVWLAHDSDLDRPVAVKFLALNRPQHRRRKDGRTEQMKVRFEKEGRAMARISSSYVAAIYDRGEDGDQLYLVMEWVNGRSLAHYMGAGNGLTLRQTVSWSTQICEGLADAHDVEVVHRDIKPGNIMITERSEVKIVDFGLARLLDSTETQGAGATWIYASPERCKNMPGDHRSDLYSLGCVMYEMLTGKPPFGGRHGDSVDVPLLHLHQRPVAPLHVRPGIPVELNSLVVSLLAKDPARRPVDARTVARLIKQVEYTPHAEDQSAREGAPAQPGTPHVNMDFVERIRELEQQIRTKERELGPSDRSVIDARFSLAELTGQSGDSRGAAALYERLGEYCKRDLSPYDPRVLDAFEAMARWIASPAGSR